MAVHELERACPSGTRRGSGADLVDGVAPDLVAYPVSTAEVAAAVRVAAAHDLTVVARGAGTKLDWGAPPQRVEVVLDLSRMSSIVEHAPDDFVVRAEAGMTLAALRGALAPHRQRLPIDELVPGSTLGGIVSTGASGPLRYGHGTVRDLLLGVTVVRADGVVARAGSKVVKNVAGYDLTKLFTGAYGTLGVLTELTFKLRPVPGRRLFVSSSYSRPVEAGVAVANVLRSQVSPAAIEFAAFGADASIEICILVEGQDSSAEMRATQLSHMVSGAQPSACPPLWWGTLPGPVVLKLSTTPSAVPALVERATAACAERGLATADMRGSPGVGVLHLGLPTGTTPQQLSGLVADLRGAVSDGHGYVTLLRAPAAMKLDVDVWGPVPGLELMRRIKERFDPGRRLSPGRFVGGI